MILGTVIHKAIEKLDKNEIPLDEIIDWANEDWYRRTKFLSKRWKSKHPPKSIVKLMTNYIEKIRPRLDLSEQVLIEHSFRIPVVYDPVNGNDVYLIGKMDRIDSNIVYDWKTSQKPPSRWELRDIQFMLYWWAYRKLFDTDPDGIYFGHLLSGTCYNIDMRETLLRDAELILDKTAEIVYNMRNKEDEASISKEFGRIGGWGKCENCIYRGICDREI